MKQVKTVPVQQYGGAFQATICSLKENSYFIFEQNVIEYYSTNKEELIQLMKNLKMYSMDEQKEILEIGPKPIFEHSHFIDSLALMQQPYGCGLKLEKSLNLYVELVIIQATEIVRSNRKDLLSSFLQNAKELQVIIFLMEAKAPCILPLVHFTQCTTLPLLDVLDLRKHYNQSYKNVEKVCYFVQFNHML